MNRFERQAMYEHDHVTVEKTQAVAKAIKEYAAEENKTVEEIVNTIIEESQPKKRGRKKGDK